jgi:ElaB/YqjD/DUF883 family membrane-anchored ribosome-binding protein
MDERQEQNEKSRIKFREKVTGQRSESVEGLSEKSASQLENEIRTIRAEMDDTLRELERKFSLGQLLDRALHRLPGGPREFAGNLGNTLRDHPLPAVLTGIGIAWLATVSNRNVRTQSSSSAGKKIQKATHSISDKVQEVGRQMRGRISKARGTMKESGESVSGTMEKARGRVGEIGHRVQERSRQMREGFVTTSQEHPFLLIGIGLALGALLAGIIPLTRQEARRMGEAEGRREGEGRQGPETAEETFHPSPGTAREETERLLH